MSSANALIAIYFMNVGNFQSNVARLRKITDIQCVAGRPTRQVSNILNGLSKHKCLGSNIKHGILENPLIFAYHMGFGKGAFTFSH